MFRNAEEKDFALYMELAQEFYHSPAVMHPIPAQYMENTFREAMRSDVYIILRILEVDGEAAGYAILSRSFSPESGSPICWIEELYIRKAYRGHGLGTKFLSSVRKEFPRRVCGSRSSRKTPARSRSTSVSASRRSSM